MTLSQPETTSVSLSPTNQVSRDISLLAFKIILVQQSSEKNKFNDFNLATLTYRVYFGYRYSQKSLTANFGLLRKPLNWSLSVVQLGA